VYRYNSLDEFLLKFQQYNYDGEREREKIGERKAEQQNGSLK
jgi:hypothetical protein